MTTLTHNLSTVAHGVMGKQSTAGLLTMQKSKAANPFIVTFSGLSNRLSFCNSFSLSHSSFSFYTAPCMNVPPPF